MKLSQWAKNQGISYLTAYRWYKSGKIPGATQQSTGTILVTEDTFKYEKTLSIISKICEIKDNTKLDQLLKVLDEKN